MREILFRGKDALTKEWIYGDLVHCENGLFMSDKVGRFVEVILETVGQFTGLTDKNGKKIFEGDICKHRSSYSGEFIISVVTYSDGCFLAMADKNSGFNLSDKLEVIGNIIDNKELLDKGE